MGIVTELRWRWLVYCYKPRHWRLRPGTIDRRVFLDVVSHNAYRLPPRLGPQDIVVDIGAHIGSFSYAALRRGAGRVYCCEANEPNFRLLGHNLAPYEDRVHRFHSIIWRSDQTMSCLALHNACDPGNTGTHQVVDAAAAPQVPVLAFDELVQRATAGGARRVRLLKLDCEGSEWPILLTARRLHLVDAICGEYHIVPATGLFGVAGRGQYTPALLRLYLEEHGFHVQICPDPKDPERLGLFFAERAGARQLAA